MDTDSHDLFKVKQPAIFLNKMIAERDRASRTKLENDGPKQNFYKEWEQQQSFHHPHNVSVIHKFDKSVIYYLRGPYVWTGLT